MTTASTIGRADLGLQPPTEQRIDDMSLEDVEALLIRKALVRHDGNVSKAAEALGLSRGALYRRMQRYGL
jgi:transcriptional regulator of acetoin/glycerol metabolism